MQMNVNIYRCNNNEKFLHKNYLSDNCQIKYYHENITCKTIIN